MPFKVYKKREDAEVYQIKENDTLANITTAKKLNEEFAHINDWKEIARYNWGTDLVQEVNRIIVEQIGYSQIDATDSSQSVLKPLEGKTPKILIPKAVFVEEIPKLSLSNLQVRPAVPKPPVAIGISKLDKWFIPETESCDISYTLEGTPACADKVKLEVFASNYSEAESSDEGEFLKFAFNSLENVPIYEAEIDPEDGRKTLEKRDWKGRSSAKNGALKGDTKEKYIDVAHSPYSVHLRYYRDDENAEARIKLMPFWPQFDKATNAGVVDPDSLTVKWSVVNSNNKLKYGQLIITESPVNPLHPEPIVFRKVLAAGDLADGNHTFKWEPEDASTIKWAKMPYRIQIQAHSDTGEENGLALAVMQTEVRLFVYDETGAHPDDPIQDPQSMHFAIAPYLPDIDENADKPSVGSDPWYKLQLAKSGFHPGPIGADASADTFELALKEFKRSCLEPDGPNFARLEANTDKNEKTKEVLENLPASKRRPFFGNPDDIPSPIATLDDLNFHIRDITDSNTINTRLKDKDSNLIVWVDDRHCYTKLNNATTDVWKPGPAEFTTDHYDMANYRGRMVENKLAKDNDSIARPWIPVEINLALLSKTQPLNITTALDLPEASASMRKAIGPISINWSFDELSSDVSLIPDGEEIPTIEIAVEGTVTGGTFLLRYDGDESDAINSDSSSSALLTAFQFLHEMKALDVGFSDQERDNRNQRISVSGPDGGPWKMFFEPNYPSGAPLVTTIVTDGSNLVGGNVAITPITTKLTRAKTYVEEILTQEPPRGYAKKDATTNKIYRNCPEQISGNSCGGIRPDDLAKYYKAAFGIGKSGSLLPWLSLDNGASKSIATFIHSDLGQDDTKLYPDLIGKCGIYFNPSRIAGDGYRYRAQVSFEKFPGADNLSHTNRKILKKRYPKLPQAYTAGMRIWRKSSFRGYVGWSQNIAPGWDTAMENAAALYKTAHVHFIHEGVNPANARQISVSGANKVVENGEFRTLISECLDGSDFDAVKNQARLTEGYIWPFVHRPHFDIPVKQMDTATFYLWLQNSLAGISLDLYIARLMYLIITKDEYKNGVGRGHLLMEFESSPKIITITRTCSANPLHISSEIVNDPTSPRTLSFRRGPQPYDLINISRRLIQCHCGANFNPLSANNVAYFEKGLPLFSSMGLALGGSYVFPRRKRDNWAHEIGHNRHFQHAQARTRKNSASPERQAPGATTTLHDSKANPYFTADVLTQYQKAWDRFCLMSYDKAIDRSFCGKCILRNRGWAVDDIADPDGDKHD